MQVRKNIAIAGAATAIGLAWLIVGVASAETSSSSSSLVDKVAEKFNLNKDEVRNGFDENRTERQAEHEQHYEERLTQAVKDGKLTEDQKSKVLAKHKEATG